MTAQSNFLLDSPTAGGMGDQLVQQLQDQLAQLRKAGAAVANPLALGDITQATLGMASSMLGLGAGGPMAKTPLGGV